MGRNARSRRAHLRRARDRGATPTFLNLGGGFPGTYREHAPAIDAVRRRSATLRLATWFPDGLDEIMVEPGRYLVADAGVLRSPRSCSCRGARPFDHERWVYLDCGKFHGLAETMDEAIRYRLRTPHDGGPTGSGRASPGRRATAPTCCTTKSGYELPLALAEGDMVDVLSAGAYTTTYSSVGFNGFAPLAEHFV